ncbi:cytochrome oxidase complex assembly protein 1-domain-containing protein [Cercophora scortea]|uniref:Cytochrome oxidase complex assembly protein 1-domain-containing protein n=1 Tax=Cercophora scortea TaxID=314031 RepID=A0AAE0M7I5_9PEZI|nr:cytochrome oxidase complex assembly protein 1-domain-containing protein [Cercophora scortea]
MLSRIALQRGGLEAAFSNSLPRIAARTSRIARPATATSSVQRQSFSSAPKPGDGPLMERRADRELPDVEANTFRWSRTLPIFLVICAVSAVAIFNYQKLSSPVVTSTLYALRTNKKAREYLGDEVYFQNQIPYISGEMNQLRGRISIEYAVKGTRNTGVMRFASHRPTARGMFETTEWSLTTSDGRVIDLLEGDDPFKGIVGGNEPDDFDEEEAARGFRKMGK